MHLSTDFASVDELLDRVMDKGIVIEALDRLGQHAAPGLLAVEVERDLHLDVVPLVVVDEVRDLAVEVRHDAGVPGP